MLKTYYKKDGVTILLGSSLDLLPDLSKDSVHLTVTDPPYGVNLVYDTYKDTEDNWFALMSKIVPELIRVSEMSILPSCQIRRMKWIYTNIPPDWLICWYKGSPGCSAYIGFNDWEPLLVYGKRKGLFIHDFLKVLNDEKMGNYGHPCPKPLGWAEWLIQRASREGEIVLDPFMGSGTTLVAAKKNKRRAIGVDISEKYCEIAAKRLDALVLEPTPDSPKVGIPD